jgi:2-phospho-L-lactate transferase/gluconeogenesis factor (CofD/UPF0052 family)
MSEVMKFFPLFKLRARLTSQGRLVRLIPEGISGTDNENSAIKELFNHRLAPSSEAARLEWLELVEARHPLWASIPSEKRELIRSFFNTINLEIVKRARPSSVFNFEAASVGNLFLTAARLSIGSFESAIYLLGLIAGIPQNVAVIPAINSNFSHHISAGLKDGTHIVGQNAISHPSAPTNLPESAEPLTPASKLQLQSHLFSKEVSEHDRVEDANLPGSLPTLRKAAIAFQKSETEDLPSRIERIWYINPYGQEIRPTPNSKVLSSIKSSKCVIYSIGSLYTSIIPCLVLKGVGEAIASQNIRFKILILNGCLDRETGPSASPFTAKEFIAAIADACASSRGFVGPVDEKKYVNYVSHIVHLEGEGTPKVPREELKKLGIETVRIYGRKVESGGMVYDGTGLLQTLEAIMGKREPRVDQSRRNTLTH